MRLLNNDKLINEARTLYANLSIKLHLKSVDSEPHHHNLESMVISAYCRYQRRLNRCVLCYRCNLEGCSRNPEQTIERKCPDILKFHSAE